MNVIGIMLPQDHVCTVQDTQLIWQIVRNASSASPTNRPVWSQDRCVNEQHIKTHIPLQIFRFRPSSATTMSPSSSLIVILASVCFSAAAPQWTSSDVPIANTTSGRLLPLLDTTFPNVYQYLGVPFAQPPINHLRFAPPQPVVSAPGLLNATLLPSACYQLTPLQNIYDEYEPGFGVFGPQSEDCLKLNVFRPSLQAQQPLPIIIYVYGGAFVEGASNQTYEIPTPWVQEKQDLIVVTIQYVRFLIITQL